ncbi:type I polyketide synthase [Chondromyces crocatus]|uniref:Polyketide synthase n=1 Tax=Chondromyces crocatus TaxID=52 RepID=G4RJB9_CHOCO|nr:type I polyketide synthase [Chondromyces crocatus]AIR74917.1 polyketide synthase [Chondromyces crocatus]AKT38863.1 polyketide synthase [Chondromyces crocatus]CBD77748.1 polyketide synthase [Chondromyces crocatus]
MSEKQPAASPGELSPLKRALLALDKMQRKVDTLERARTEPIAIVGMACRFPGSANDTEAYWRILRDGVTTVTEIPKDRWDIDAFYDPDPEAPAKMYARHGAFIDQVERFDAEFFGISPREARTMDPQQRLLLEVAHEALEQSGHAPDRLFDSQTGVFVGMSYSDYSRLTIDESTTLDAYVGTGSGLSIGVGRLSYFLGLHGPNVQLDTTCSSSLVATHLAAQSLRNGECDLALAGGVNLMLAPQGHLFYCKLQALSRDGRCKTFDAAADGYVRGEGCGILVLKRLSDAERDGDQILALLRGSAVNHDGRSNGLTAPNGPAQEAVIRRALAAAGVSPADVDYVECHGTGTPLGDPIEFQALAAVMRKGRQAERPLYVGSAKTNIGHLEPAAGAAGLIKAVLALKHRTIPPHLHFERANPNIDLASIPALVPPSALPWNTDGKRRLAGVSSFGMSGTNAHVILEEAPSAPARRQDVERPLHLLTLSARTDAALTAQVDHYAQHLAASTQTPLADLCFTAGTGRTHFAHRVAVVASSTEEASLALAALRDGGTSPSALRAPTAAQTPPEIVFLFTGQGSQYAGMARALYETSPSFKRRLDACADLLAPHLSRPLLGILFPDEQESGLLDQTEFTQPALFALEVALCGTLRDWGIVPAAVIGHSVGEYAAACAAGVFSLEDGLALISARARLMQALPEPGGMMAVFAEPERIGDLLRAHESRVTIAAINAPGETVISGATDALAAIGAALQARGIKNRPLKVSHAFHSPLLEPMRRDFERVAAGVNFTAPQLRLVSNLTGELMTDAPTAEYWWRQMREPVQFLAGIRTLRQQGHRCFLEIGPQPTLVAMARREAGAADDIDWLPTLKQGAGDWQPLLESLARLHVRGASVDWAAFDRDYPRRRVALPTYPFQRKRYWAAKRPEAPDQAATTGAAGEAVHPLLGHRLPTALNATLFTAKLDPETLGYLQDHRVYGQMVLPMTAYIEMALSAAQEVYGPSVSVLEDLVIQAPLVLPPTGTAHVQTILGAAEEGRAEFRICSPKDETCSEWQVHVQGFARIDGEGQEIASTIEPIAALKGRCPAEIPREAHYALYHQQGLEYGPAFQSLRRLHQGNAEALGEVALDDALAVDVARYRVHPALLDSALQVLGATIGGTGDEADKDAVHLPAGLKRFRLHRQPGTSTFSHARLQRAMDNPSAPVSGDVRLLDEAGEPVAELTGWLLLPAPRALIAQVSSRPRFAEWLYDLRWSRRDAPASGDTDTTRTGARERWVLLADQSGTGAALAALLRDRGHDVHLAAIEAPLAEDASRARYHQIVEDALRDAPPGGVKFVHLGGLDAEDPDALDADPASSFASAQAHGCASALYLIQTLKAAASPLPSRVWFVTRGAQSIANAEPIRAPQQALLWGLARGLALEAPELWGGILDLDPARSSDEARLLFGALQSADGEDQVTLRGDARYVLRLARRTAPPVPPLQVRADGSYLVTGGLGDLGLLTARWLAARGAGRILLMSRRPWEETLATATASSRHSKQTLLDELRRSGASIEILAADVGDRAQMERVFDDLRRSSFPLRGIFHAAGVFSHRDLQALDAAALRETLAPKVTGGYLLHRLSEGLDLDAFVCFSSISAVWGSAGMLAYGAANQYLAALARQRRSAGRPAVCIHWGPWEGEGMAARAGSKDWLERMGIHGLPPEQAILAMDSLCGIDETEVVVARVDFRRFRPVYEARARRPLLTELAPSTPTKAATTRRRKSDVRGQLDTASPAERDALLSRYLVELVGDVMRLDDAASLDPETPLTKMGLDSLMAVELRNRIEQDLGQPIELAELLQSPSVRRLHELLAAPATPASITSSRATSDDLLELVRNIDHETMQTLLARIERLDEPALNTLLQQVEGMEGAP